jgi:hypothetical protein
MVIQSTDVSSRLEKKRKTDGSSSSSSSRPYEVLISMPLSEDGVPDDVERWYIMKIHADAVDGAEGSISEVWRHRMPEANSTFALLGSDLYSVGGRRFNSDELPYLIDNVYKVNIRHPAGNWIPVKSMISPRMFPHILVLGGKLYVLSGHYYSPSGVSLSYPGGEVYDPITNLWEALPAPPCHMGTQILSAALENPNRILVASIPLVYDPNFRSFANFFIYEVQSCSWKMLDPACRKLHKYPLGPFMGRSVAVGNYIYWITIDFKLLAYDFELDLWLTGWIEGLDLPVPGYEPPYIPRLFHLEKERFCIIKFTTVRDPPRRLLHCILFDVLSCAREE